MWPGHILQAFVHHIQGVSMLLPWRRALPISQSMSKHWALGLCVLKDVPVLFELLEKPQQFKHGSEFCLCVRVLTLGWGMVTSLTLDRRCNTPDEHWVNRDRLQSPPPFVIKRPCTLPTLNKGEIFHCLKPVIKMLLCTKSLPITNTPQTFLFRLEMV